MYQKPQLLWKDFKNICQCKWYRLIRKLSYPSCILPKVSYQAKLNIDDLVNNFDIFLLRRSNKKKSETFNELGILREDAIVGNEVPFLSMNLLGGLFKAKHCKYNPKMKTKATEKWDGNKRIYLADFINDYAVLPITSQIVYNVKDIHNIPVPFSVSESNKDGKKLFEALKAKKVGTRFELLGKTSIEHDPTNLNYWHAELVLWDFKSDPVVKYKNEWQTTSIGYIISHVLTMKAMQSPPPNLRKIRKQDYRI